MVRIENYEEKRLIIARYFILQKNVGKSFDEKDVFYMWRNYFPKDFKVSKRSNGKFEDGEIKLPVKTNRCSNRIKHLNESWKISYAWLADYIEKNDIETFKADIAKLRKHNKMMLKKNASAIQCRVKLREEHENRLADYCLCGKKLYKSGTYAKLTKDIADIRKGWDKQKKIADVGSKPYQQ